MRKVYSMEIEESIMEDMVRLHGKRERMYTEHPESLDRYIETALYLFIGIVTYQEFIRYKTIGTFEKDN